MNRIDQVFSGSKDFEEKNKKILSVYFTAGYPQIDDTIDIIKNLAGAGVEMIEIGLPFSDPLADGPTIQESSTLALNNGMTTEKLFEQLSGIRNEIDIPLLIMGYFNPILQYGVAEFCSRCAEIGIDGLIIPDLPVDVYDSNYKSIFEKYGLYNVFLITPQTSEERIRYIDKISKGFIYMVSSASTTGAKDRFDDEQVSYFKRIDSMQLKSPKVIGFGISNHQTFMQATEHAEGAIIGSAFVKFLSDHSIEQIDQFTQSILRGSK